MMEPTPEAVEVAETWFAMPIGSTMQEDERKLALGIDGLVARRVAEKDAEIADLKACVSAYQKELAATQAERERMRSRYHGAIEEGMATETALKAEIAALRAQVEWRPIETAPKDGEDILVGHYSIRCGELRIGLMLSTPFMRKERRDQPTIIPATNLAALAIYGTVATPSPAKETAIMGTKNNPGNFDCYANAAPDEPMFILLGRDPHAHSAVRKWAQDREAMIRAGLKPTGDMRMVWEARECADAMEQFHINRSAKQRGEQPPGVSTGDGNG